MRVALDNCVLVDGTSAAPQSGVALVIEDGRIAAVADRDSCGSDTLVVDVEGATVMPGLIDCHMHFALWSFELLSHLDSPLSYLHAKTLRALREVLESGCTSARDPGGLDAGFRDAIADGVCPGPRIQTSVTIVSPTNGIADSTRGQGVPVPFPPGMPRPECNGVDEARKKVRELVRAGADFIKLAVSGGVSSASRAVHHQLFGDDEIAAVVDEAHAWDLPVACHALGGPGPLVAIRAGVDTIEHGVWLDDEAVEEMASRGTWYVPTFAGYEWHEQHGGELQRERALAQHAGHRESFQRARAAGVRIACGSDAGVYGHDFTRELELLVEAGMTPGEAIVAATSDAAACIGVADRVGRVQAGMEADLLVVDGDPTTDIGVLGTPGAVRAVLKGGEVAHDPAGMFVGSTRPVAA